MRRSIQIGSKLRSLRPALHPNPYVPRCIFTRSAVAASSLWEDKAPNEARGTRPPIKPSLDYCTEIMIDFKNFRDLNERFEQAVDERDEEKIKSVASTLVYEVSKYTAGKEFCVHKSLAENGLDSLAEKDRQQCSRLEQVFLNIDKSIGSHTADDRFIADVRQACSLLLDNVEKEEKAQHETLKSILNGPQKSKLAMEYLKARETAAKRPRPTRDVTDKLVATLARPSDAIASAQRSYVELRYPHSDPDLA
ncbi:hypothetical protein RhiJN_20870 [Ceratobasidium sp. AG-Ba]|nr:hypothetical protein RhiJN_20870 [Ceratobasidium sp. AG-Ba]